MDYRKRLTHKRTNGIRQGFWTDKKKDELTQRLGEYEETGLAPDEITQMKPEKVASEKFDEFLREVKEALKKYEQDCLKPPVYTSKICFIAEILAITADNPVELCFTASQIKKVLDLAKEKSA